PVLLDSCSWLTSLLLNTRSEMRHDLQAVLNFSLSLAVEWKQAQVEAIHLERGDQQYFFVVVKSCQKHLSNGQTHRLELAFEDAQVLSSKDDVAVLRTFLATFPLQWLLEEFECLQDA